ncbi:MAG: hypothetical protein V2L15_03730, partial [Desulfobacteraceae bacterium]|nr:hypothetical protein [Desulfobacteraceae bacterium]
MGSLDLARKAGRRLGGALFATAAMLLLAGGVQASETRQVKDAAGRILTIPKTVERVICSG